MSDRLKIDQLFQYAENFIYIVIGIMLMVSSLFLIYDEIITFLDYPNVTDHIKWIVEIIAKTLLLLMVIEILYTVRVSLRDHSLCAEPFLIVGMIAALRRILVISVETAYVPEKFDLHMIEVSILGGLILIFVISIILLRKHKQIKINNNQGG